MPLNVEWLKPDKENTKYHAFIVSRIIDTNYYDSFCGNHGFDSTELDQLLDVPNDMGVSSFDLVEKFPQHCCKKCLISYKHHMKGV